jgi:hypothetical protein
MRELMGLVITDAAVVAADAVIGGESRCAVRVITNAVTCDAKTARQTSNERRRFWRAANA